MGNDDMKQRRSCFVEKNLCSLDEKTAVDRIYESIIKDLHF